MSTVLLKTKLYIPVARPELVSRLRLIKRLNEGLSRKLILIAAPAGYGKTTLLSSWARGCGQPVAWFSIDDRDNEPTRFLAYLVAALQTIEANLGEDILSAMRSSQSSMIADWLPVLINQLDNIAQPFVLVLDDYHLITTPAIHQALTFLIEHQPAHMHVVIATRKDPSLPLPRLRARGQLVELRQADLRFTSEETSTFLRLATGAELPMEDVSALVTRTEGWVAGLQMAALSIRDREDVSRMIAAFGGSHAYIVDYFAAEVLDQQSEPIKNFLRQTSILDQLYGSLCEAVTGQTGGQQTLEHLQQANLFVVSLSDDRCCYRYHHLFRDLLLKQLRQEQPELVPELHRRASQWCEEQGLIYDAIEHALAAHDEPRLARLLAVHAESFFLSGEHATLLRWIAALPEAQRRPRPALGILRAIMYSAAGMNHEAALALSEVDQTLSGLDERDSRNRGLLGRSAAAHAMVATAHEDPQVILDYARQSLDLVSDQSGWHSSVLLASSNAYFLLGDLAACVEALSAGIDIAILRQSHLLVLIEQAKLAQTYWMQGHLQQAANVCQAGLHYIDQCGLAQSPNCDHILLTWGAILCEQGDLDRATEFILRGLDMGRSRQVVTNELFGYRSMIRVCLAKHDMFGAEKYLRQAETLTQAYDIPGQHVSPITAMKAQLLIQQSRWAEAEYELRVLDARADDEIPFIQHGRLYLALTQLRMAQGNLPAADQTLDRLSTFSQASGQRRWMIPIQVLRAVLQLTRQDLPHALRALEPALELAEPEGFIQDFLDEGEPMNRLLHEAIRHKVKPEFAHQLLNRFSPDRSVEKPIGLVEPLSERELEVLKLVAEGLSNQEIAARLYLSLRTIKFHTGNIYGKLGAKSRTEAVSRARDLGLLTS
ncbi:MAG TPA: LuxR C-terminal-related transcriptional regulator [Anaerolineae bacterium]|nr:LuxR C-terminal-related transcriptional regulator [Anaerolineae bacterium]